MSKYDDIYLNKTCAHFGKFDLIDEKMKKIGTYQSLYDSDLHEAFKSHHIIRQEEISDKKLLDGVKLIGEQLGVGGFGTAFRCQFRGETYVIKLPNDLLKNKLLYFNSGGVLECRSENRYYRRQMERSLISFEEECEFNEMALDPISHRRIRNHEVGSNIKHANHTQYIQIKNELDHMKLHEGYNHIHKILGFFPELPAIFSEPCSGSLESLIMRTNDDMFRGGFERKLSFQWLEMVRQIGSAIEYLHDIPHIAHLDIKPGNILYIETRDKDYNSVFNWKLSDFGWCQVWDDGGLGYQTMDLKGTPKFLPRILRDSAKDNTMFYYDAYECSLHCFMATIIMCINFDIHSEEGYLFKNSINFNNPSKKDFDVVDCVNEFPIILNMFKVNAKLAIGGDGEDGEMFNSERDHPLEMLSLMFFSPLSEKSDHFVNLMETVRLELRIRRNKFPESNGRCVVMPNYNSTDSVDDSFSDTTSVHPNYSSYLDWSPVIGYVPSVMSNGSRNDGEISDYHPHLSSGSGSRNGPSYQRFSSDVSDYHPLPVSLNHAKRNLPENEHTNKSQKFSRHS